MEEDGADFIRAHIEFIDIQKDKIVHKDPVDEMEKYYEQYYYCLLYTSDAADE